MVKLHDWNLVRLLCSVGDSLKTTRPRAGVHTSAGRSPLSLLSLLVRLSSLLLLLLLPLMPPKSVLPGETNGIGGLPSAPPSAPAPGSASGTSCVVGGTGGHISAISKLNWLYKSSTFPPP